MDKIFDWAYEHFGLPGLIVLVVVIFGTVLSIQPIDGRRVDIAKVEADVSSHFTNVVMGEKEVLWAFAWKSCSRNDSAMIPFSMVDDSGMTVNGNVCIRAFTHELSYYFSTSP